MASWYQSLATSQKIFLFTISGIFSIFLVGIPFLVFLAYMEIGNRSLPYSKPYYKGTFHDHKTKLMKDVRNIQKLSAFIKNYLMETWVLEEELAENLAYWFVYETGSDQLFLFEINYDYQEAIEKKSKYKKSPYHPRPPHFDVSESRWFKLILKDQIDLHMNSVRYRLLRAKVIPGSAKDVVHELLCIHSPSKLDTWYRDGTSRSQRSFIWASAVISSFFFIGVPALLLLVYLELGRLSYQQLTQVAYPKSNTASESIGFKIKAYILKNGEPNISEVKAQALAKERTSSVWAEQQVDDVTRLTTLDD